MTTLETDDRFIVLPSGRRVFNTGKVLVGEHFGITSTPRKLDWGLKPNLSVDAENLQAALLSPPPKTWLRRLLASLHTKGEKT